MTPHPLERRATVAWGGALPALEQLVGRTRDWHAALPFTRLTDYGMEPADARELLWRTARHEDWTSVAREIGSRQLARADAASGQAGGRTELISVRAGGAALNVAQVPINSDSELKRELYAQFQQAVARYAALRGGMERVSLPYADAAVDGWLLFPRGAPAAAVVVWGGLSGWGAAYLGIAEELTARGLVCVLAEGPGQGTTRLDSFLHAAEDALGGYRRFIDLLAADPRTSAMPIGIYGNSIGGMIAARVTAIDRRVRACAINCAPAAVELPDAVGPRGQFLAFLGLEGRLEEAQRSIRRLNFDPQRDQIDAALLVLHGGADGLVTRESAAEFLAAARAESAANLLTWPDGEHTLYNHSSERDAIVADWFAERLTENDG